MWWFLVINKLHFQHNIHWHISYHDYLFEYHNKNLISGGFCQPFNEFMMNVLYIIVIFNFKDFCERKWHSKIEVCQICTRKIFEKNQGSYSESKLTTVKSWSWSALTCWVFMYYTLMCFYPQCFCFDSSWRLFGNSNPFIKKLWSVVCQSKMSRPLQRPAGMSPYVKSHLPPPNSKFRGLFKTLF